MKVKLLTLYSNQNESQVVNTVLELKWKSSCCHLPTLIIASILFLNVCDAYIADLPGIEN